MTRTTMTTSKGETFTSTLSDPEAFKTLQDAMERGALGSFGTSLVLQARLRGLSPKQWVWVHKLAMEKVTPAPAPAPAIAALAEPEVTGGLQVLVDMLQRAGASLKWPRIVFQGLRISLAGGKHPGSLNVTDDARAFADRTWYGRITPGGSFQAARGCPETVAVVLATLAADPAGQTKAEGQRVGACCYCARELTTKESLAAGYGPVCAEKYGLPWG